MPWWCAMNERTVATRLPARDAAGRVVDRLVEAVAPRRAQSAARRRRLLHAASASTISASAVAYGAMTRSSARPRLKPRPGTPNAWYW